MTYTPRRFGVLPPGDLLAQIQKNIIPLENERECPLPTPTGPSPYRLSLSDVIPNDPTDKLVFHLTGDTGGVLDPDPQIAVADAMVADAKINGLHFGYIVGDVVYFTGEDSQYYPQFYSPYEHYLYPILAIPGNHDGVTTLDPFVENFCAKTPHFTDEAMDSERDAMTQPNVYWTLNANLCTIIGLYTNAPSGGVVHPDQEEWFINELKAADSSKPIIVTLHHPPFSADAMHGGSAKMGTLLDNAFKTSDVCPDLVISGHIHNYQRFTRPKMNVNGLPYDVCYIVTGAGGYHNLHAMAQGASPGQQIGEVILENFCANAYGFLRLAITSDLKINGIYTAVALDGTTKGLDLFEIDCEARTIS